MSTFITGSICLTDLADQYKKGHSAFSRSDKNQKVYVNIKCWLNDEPDQFKNNMSFMLNSKKEKADSEKTANGGKEIYFGNAKIVSTGGGGASTPATTTDTSSFSMDDLPF